MSELEQIIAAAAAARNRGVDAVLVTVIRVAGSTYRRPGARMLLSLDGERVGAISGGCLERELHQKAAWLTETGRPVVVRYDTSSGDEAVWEFGLGCQGVVWVLLERLQAGEPSPFLAFLEHCLAARRNGWVATVVATAGRADVVVGERWCSERDNFTDADFRPAISGQEQGDSGVAPFGENGLRQYSVPGGTIETFVERIELAPQLLVLGAGHDAAPLVRLAAELGYAVTVVDSRAAYAAPRRFPEARRVVACRPGEISAHVEFDPRTFAVVMTHNAYDDAALLRALLPSPVSYVGLLGPRSRTDAVLAALADDGVKISSAQRSRLHAPVGLDLGAESPAEIALAVLAEVQAVRARHPAGFLRDRDGPIHAPPAPAAASIRSLLDHPPAAGSTAAGSSACPIPSRS